MNPFLKFFLVEQAKKRLENQKKEQSYTNRQLVEQVKLLKIEFSHSIKKFFFMSFGVLAAGFGLKGFLLPNDFIDGGATGVSLLIQVITDFSLGILLILVNAPFILLGAKTINKKFAVKSVVAIIMLALAVHFIEYPIVTSDKLLVAFFGGFFLGLGIGMTMRGGGVIDGTEVLAIYLSRKLHITIGDVLLLINIIIFSAGAYLLSIETALYAILTYLIAAKTVDFIVDGVEEYVGVTIVSDKSEEIRIMLTQKMGRACTIYYGKKGYSKDGQTPSDTSIVYTVVTRLELARLNTEIEKVDKNAFVVMNVVKDIKGGMIKKKPLKD